MRNAKQTLQRSGLPQGYRYLQRLWESRLKFSLLRAHCLDATHQAGLLVAVTSRGLLHLKTFSYHLQVHSF